MCYFFLRIFKKEKSWKIFKNSGGCKIPAFVCGEYDSGQTANWEQTIPVDLETRKDYLRTMREKEREMKRIFEKKKNDLQILDWICNMFFAFCFLLFISF